MSYLDLTVTSAPSTPATNHAELFVNSSNKHLSTIDDSGTVRDFGGGTINSGTNGQIAYYPSTGPTVSSSAAVTVGSNGPNGIIAGTNTNDNAAAGIVGEYIESLKTSSTTGSTTIGTYTDSGVSIALTAGDWDVYYSAQVEIAGATATGTNGAVAHLTLTDNSNTILTDASGGFMNTTMPLGETWLSGRKRISISGSTTYKTRFTATNNGGGSLTISSLVLNAGANMPITLFARRVR